MIRPAQLAALVTNRTGTSSPPVPLPTPGDVLFAPANADGSRKNCRNCALWFEADELCLVHGDQRVVGDMVCGYHVFGQPQVYAASVIHPPGMDPALTGLELIPGGTSCDLCEYSGGGKCRAVADPRTGQPPWRVEPLDCCARWRPSDHDGDDG